MTNENKSPELKKPRVSEAEAERKKAKVDKKKTFNVVDAVLVLLTLTVLAILVFFFASGGRLDLSAGKSVKVEYTVEIPGITQEMAAKIHVNDQVFDGDNQHVIGSVINTEIDDCVEYIYNPASGRIEPVVYVDEGSYFSVRKTVLVTITADAKYAPGNGYTVNGYRIAVNRDMTLCLPEYTGTGKCISITVSETEDR